MAQKITPPFVFLDTETDGVHPGRKVWEVGMIRVDPDGTEKETGFFVALELDTADPFGLKVGRFYERHPYGRWLSSPDATVAEPVTSPQAAAETVARWTHEAIIVGAVPNFDTEVLGNLLRAEGLLPTWHYHLVDVETLAAGAMRQPPPWNFDKLLAAYGLTYDEADRHTALGDARMAKRLFEAVLIQGAETAGA